MYDGFIRECPSLQRSYPAWIVVYRNVTGDSADSFSVCVEEFFQAVDVTDFVLYDCGVCVIWKGEDVYAMAFQTQLWPSCRSHGESQLSQPRLFQCVETVEWLV